MQGNRDDNTINGGLTSTIAITPASFPARSPRIVVASSGEEKMSTSLLFFML
jgi:hypothetical protein